MKKLCKFEVLLIIIFVLIYDLLASVGFYGGYYHGDTYYLKYLRTNGEKWNAKSVFHGYSALYTFDLPVQNWMQVNKYYMQQKSDLELLNWRLKSQIDVYVYSTINFNFETVVELAKQRIEKLASDTAIEKTEVYQDMNGLQPTSYVKFDNFAIGYRSHTALVKTVATKDYIFEFSAITALKDTAELEKIFDTMRPM